MSFQQKMYVAFWLSMVMAATGAVMAIRNDRAVEGASYWILLAALFPFTAGLPAFVNQHLDLWKPTDKADPDERRRGRHQCKRLGRIPTQNQRRTLR